MIRIGYRVVAVFLLSCGACGCVSTQAVQQYAAYSRTMIDQVQPVAADFYDSCVRSNQYRPFENRSQCTSEKAAAAGIGNVALVLDRYNSALGALAADSKVAFDKELDGLAAEIGTLPIGVNKTQIDAVGSIAKLLANAAASGYQKHEVAKFVRQANTSVFVVADALASMIEKNYDLAISNELLAWESSFRTAEKTSKDLHSPTWNSYADAQWQQRAGLEKKLEASKMLAAALRRIGATHQQLSDDADKLSSAEIAAAVTAFYDKAKPVLAQSRAAFK